MKKMFIASFSMIVLLFMLAGCSQSPFAKNSTNTSDHTTDTEYVIDLSTFPEQIFGKTETTGTDVATTNSGTTSDFEVTPEPDSHKVTDEPITESTSDQESDTDTDPDPTSDSSSNDNPSNEPEIEMESQPRLIGFAVGDKMQNVRSALGTPNDQFVMDDTEGKIQIDQYKGFTIGYNSSNRIEFIDVYEAAVDPLLNGVQIGQHISDAILTLGIPSSQSEFVVNYLVEGIYLKIDIDPGTQTIQTIKMFKSE